MFRVYIFTFLLFITIGCDTIIPEDINLNPNSPSEAPEDLVLTGSMVGTILFHEGATARRSGIWSGYFRFKDNLYSSYPIFYKQFDIYNIIFIIDRSGL